MEAIIEGLAQYGPLGLWTASLLWMNWQQRKDQKEEEQRAADMLRYHQENITTRLENQEKMLERALIKLDDGLTAMREKYAEERIFRMKSDK